VHRPAAAFKTSIRIALPPSALPSFFNPFPQTLPRLVAWSLGRSVARSHDALSTPPAWSHLESCFIGLTKAENHAAMVSLKPESSISHLRVDAHECLRWWLFLKVKIQHIHELYCLSSLSHHHHHPYTMPSVITTVSICLGSEFYALRPGQSQKCLIATWLTST